MPGPWTAPRRRRRRASTVSAASSKARRPLPLPASLVAVVTLRTAHEEVKRIISEREAAAGKPYRDAMPFCPKPDENASSDDDGGVAGLPDMAYEVTVKLW